LERDMRRRGAFSLYWDSNAFALGCKLILLDIASYFSVFFSFTPNCFHKKFIISISYFKNTILR